ncbi:hypothetical protein QTP86_001922 [Hemibagrus guttatus]|nr:hypothetical protein QTP86_001922 [Hemibagrus guttatus]
MELASQSVNDLFLSKGDLSLALEHVAPAETALDHTVQDITAQIIGLGEGKLDLYVPSEAIIEPISPAEVMPEESALAMTPYESMENGMTVHPLQSNHSSDPGLPNELIAISSSVSDSNPSEAPEDSAVRTAIAPSCDMSLGDLTAHGETGISTEDASVKKLIPPKKDRMDPLKMDMSKPTVIPLTSSQLSLQCLECHIIFSDDKSKQRHLKMNHPTEYEQCMLGDALFACYVCDQHFTCSTDLMAHQRSHTEKQPFKCPICGEAFGRSSELTSHKKPIVQQVVLQPAWDKKGHEGTSAGNEQDTLLESLELEVAVEQKKTEVQDETTISAECPEKQVTVVESNITGVQENDIRYELLPELTEKDILPPQLEASHQLMLTTEEQQGQHVIDVKTPEKGNDSSLAVITDFESKVTSEKEFVTKPTDIIVSENTSTNAEPSQTASEAADSLTETETQTVQGNVVSPDMTNTSEDPLSLKPSEALCSLVEPEPQTEQGNLDELDKTSNDAESQCQKAMEATDSLVELRPKNEQRNFNLDNAEEIEAQPEQQHLQEILSSEEQMLQVSKPSLGNVQHDQERSHLEQGPCSESNAQQSRVEPEDQTLLAEDSLYIKKTLPIKKKRSKKQVKFQYLENQDGVAKSTLSITSNQKNKTVSKTPKKQEKTKKHFGSKQNKKKYSKKKLLNISQTSVYNDQQDTDPKNVPGLSHNEIEKLKQKHKKGRKTEKSAGLIQALKLPSEKKVMKVSEQADRGKPQKRKFENHRDSVNKGKSTQETQQEETPVPKKKKAGKIPEAASQKKAKDNITVNKVNKKSHKIVKQREKNKNVSETLVIDQIKQQALLLLKGHKQPQLKVHKLDAKTTGLDHQLIHKSQTKEIYGYETTVEQAKEEIQNKPLQAPSQKKKKAKALGKKSKVDSKQSSYVQTSPVKGDSPPGVKQKVVRKRKSPAKIDQEIALSPPYSRLIIGCHDCGKSFSEVSALQEHMALLHSENAAHQSVVPCDVSEMSTVNLKPNEIMLTNAVHSSGFEIHVPTDWDVDSEMREIGLGDEHRNEHRLSFPALSPSPSFPMTTTFVEEEGKQYDNLSQEPSLGYKKAVSKNSDCPLEINESKIGEQDVHSLPPVSLSDPQKSMEDEEALPLAVNFEDKHGEGSHISTKLCSSHKVPDIQEGQTRHNTLSPSFAQKQLPTKPVNPASTYNAESHETEQTDIKQEADEIAVQTVASQTNTSMTKGKRGRGNKSRGKRQLGKRRSGEKRHTEEANEEDCQVVFELYSLTGNSEENNEEILQKRKSINATAESMHPAMKESSEAPEVHVLPQPLTASDLEMMNSENSSLMQKSGEHDKNSASSSFKRGRNSVSGMRGQGNLQSENRSSSVGTSAAVKIETSLSALTSNDVQANDGDFLQGVQMILVKAEDQQISNDPHILQEAQHVQTNRNAGLEKHPDRPTVGISSGSPTVAQSTAKHCIFYPVKEEEREMLVEPQVNNQGTSGSEVLEERTGPWGVHGLEESEIRIGCSQMEMHHNLYSSTDEGSVGAEQQSTEDILEFLSQTSDMEDIDGVHSEPEAETHIMSCYHGIYANGTVRQCEIASTEQHAKTSKNAGCPEADDQLAGSKEHCEPIDYFIRYFSWSIWKDIAACTQQTSKSPKPVTEKEVAQFVGIHIAMGTLKFPSVKLYWDDFTRVPLIADAMSAAMFSELTSNLRLASLPGNRPNCNGQDAHKAQDAHDCTGILVSKKDPLWKVQAIVNRVREGCQALKRSGNYGVDQYPLPFQRHPTHSLHHTVMINAAGLVMDFNLRVSDCNREEIVEKMVSREKSDNQGVVFLCKPELSTPSMLEHLLEAGVRSAGKTIFIVCMFLTPVEDLHIVPLYRMDSDILKIEEIVMGGGEAAPPADVNPEKAGKPYTTIIIQEPSPAPVLQSYQHESLQCFQCFITFCNSKAKERHMKKSHREEYKQQLQQLTTHRRQVCPERQFVCKECNETFRSPALLRTHRLAQHPARPDGDDTDDPSKTHRCGKCGRGFEEESELLHHQENHAANQHCNGSGPVKRRGRPPKAETSSATVEKKQKRSENEMAEKSEDTPPAAAAAPVAAEAKPKMEGRRGRPPKSASQDPKAEENKSDSKKTKAVSSTARQIPCPECDHVFSSPAQLRAHKKEKHTQRKAHPCQECEESFNRAEQLEAHMARAHKAGRYSCSTCGKSFGRESNLKAHQQSHGKEDEKSAGGSKR